MAAKKRPVSRRPSRRSGSVPSPARVLVENVNHPGQSRPVGAANYSAMRRALLRTLPRKAPGFTQAEMFRGVLRHLPADLFPGGAKAGWWAKTVQLDLEAKKVIAREKTTPLRWHRS